MYARAYRRLMADERLRVAVESLAVSTAGIMLGVAQPALPRVLWPLAWTAGYALPAAGGVLLALGLRDIEQSE